MAKLSLALLIAIFCIGHLTAEKAKQRSPQIRFNWKAGTNSQCEEKNPKLVDEDFIAQKEGFRLTGYVPCGADKMTACSSGVTIGVGVDMAYKNAEYFKDKLSPDDALDKGLLDKITPYFGLKDKAAVEKLKDLPLTLTDKEELRLREVVFKASLESLIRIYEKYRVRSMSSSFGELPIGVRTALFSFSYQHGSIFSAKGLSNEAKIVRKQIFDSIVVNDFKRVSSGIRRLGELFPDFRSRRRDEADLIDSEFLKCDRLFDIFFVLDESQSVGITAFERAKDLIVSFIKKFENRNSRVGVITYSNKAVVVHDLDYLTNSDKIIEDIKKHKYEGSYTRTGNAMTTGIDLILKQKRPESEGISYKMFVITDGVADDDVKVPAQRARDNKIVVNAIGIGDAIKRSGLVDIAYDEAHIINFTNYEQLQCNVDRMIAESCVQAKMIDLEVPVTSVLKPENHDYFSFELAKTEGLIVKIKKENTDLPMKIFASVHDPNPDSIVQEVKNSGFKNHEEVLTITYSIQQQPEESFAFESLSANGEDERALFSEEDTFVSELSKEMTVHLHESYDDTDFDFPSPQKTYPRENYNVYLSLGSSNNQPITFRIETSTCEIGEAGCVNGSKDADEKPGWGKFFFWVFLLVFAAVLAASAYYLYTKRLRQVNNAEYIAA